METPVKILHIDDDAVVRMLVKHMLPDYEVFHATHAIAGLGLARQTRFDAVLVDIRLGEGMSGMDLCVELRSIPGYTGVPIAAVTALWFAAPETVFRSGFTHFLPKPFEKNELRNLVVDMLDAVLIRR